MAGLHELITAQHPEGTVELVDGVFELADRWVRNGELTRSELGTYLAGSEYDAFYDFLTQNWKSSRVDANMDGVIDRYEMADAAAAFINSQPEPEPEPPLDLGLLSSELSPTDLLKIAVAVARRERASRKECAARLKQTRMDGKVRRHSCQQRGLELKQAAAEASSVLSKRDLLRQQCRGAGVQLGPSGLALASPGRVRPQPMVEMDEEREVSKDLEVWLEVMRAELDKTQKELSLYRMAARPVVLYSWHELAWAASGFDEQSCLGRGDWSSDHLVYVGQTVAMLKLFDHRSPLFGFISTDPMQIVQALGQLDAPSCFPVLGLATARNQCCVVHRYMPDGSLHQRLADNLSTGEMALDWRSRVKVAYTAAAALEQLHAAGMVHGVLQSSNVMLEAGCSQCYLGEHYLSALCGGPAQLTQVFRLKRMFDSPWMDPSLADGAQLSSQTDIYSLGVVLLELLLGRLPDARGPVPPGGLLRTAEKFHGRANLLKVLDSQAGAWDLNAASIMHKLACSCLVPSEEARPSSKEAARELERLLHLEDKKTRHEVVAARAAR